MENEMMTKTGVVVLLVTLFLLVTVFLQVSFAQNPNASVVPPNSVVFGKTYAGWSAEHWKWLYSIPVSKSPAVDDTGKNCAEGQNFPLWFLVGTFSVNPTAPNVVEGRAARNCTIPAGKEILFPVINAECSTVEGNGATEEELRSCAKFLADHVTVASATVDGVDLHGLNPPQSPFRVQSPLFIFTLPPNNLLGVKVQGSSLSSPSVSDGYWVILQPLLPGQHTIHFAGEFVFSTAAGDPFDFTFILDITYSLTVT